MFVFICVFDRKIDTIAPKLSSMWWESGLDLGHENGIEEVH